MPTPDDTDLPKDSDAGHEAKDSETQDQPGSEARKVDADAALSPASEQGGAALANIGSRRGSELFRED